MSTSAQSRPRGILKNPSHDVLPTTSPDKSTISTSPAVAASTSPDLTLQNTMQNAGVPRRTSSQTARNSVSRRTSSVGGAQASSENPENEMRLKWDERNIYLYEQEKTPKMKIDEPKTPYAKRYDPTEDEEEDRTLDAQDLVVDELDKAKQQGSASGGTRGRQPKENDIPGLDIGEPSDDMNAFVGNEGMGGRDDSGRIVPERSESAGSNKDKQVQVDEDMTEEGKHDGQKRHRDFEEMRKKHYEMKNVKGMLGHSAAELMDEDDDEEPPPVPKVGDKVVNGA